MKKIITLLAILPLATGLYAQAITITAADVPLPGNINGEDLTTGAAPEPTVSTNGTWNYGTYTGGSFLTVYMPETDTFFTNIGVDVFTSGFKTLSGSTGMGYYIYSELDFSSTGVRETALDILPQFYDLSAFTGSTLDSLIIPAQKLRLATPKDIMRFPFTANSSWTTVSRRIMNFTLTVASASLDHVPAQHVSYATRQDTIVGWGKLSVHTASGPSIQYDVLMDKISQYSEDSFYLAGAPGPTALLTAFGLSQNQRTDSQYRYNFYRKGAYNYLMSFYYGRNPALNTPSAKYINTDNLIPADVNDVRSGTFSVALFPNPTNGNFINLMISGKDLSDGNYYTITDLTGRTIQSGELRAQQGVMHIDFANTFANGPYLITMMDANNNKITTEQFTVAR